MHRDHPPAHDLGRVTGHDDGGALGKTDAEQIRMLLDDRNDVVPPVAGVDVLVDGRTAQKLESQLVILLLAFWLYMDGIGTIIKMGAVYAAEIGIGDTDVIGAFLLVQFLGIPFTFGFGALAGRIGARAGIYIALSVYTVISIFAFFMSSRPLPRSSAPSSISG